jgi:hypothetical protein
MKTVKSRILALIASIGALFGCCGGACAASGCCGSYALFGFIGFSSVSMKFIEKLTPFFLILTILSLSFAFYKAYKPKYAECCNSENRHASSDCCSTPKQTIFIQSKSFLWAITIVTVIMWTYPYFSKLNATDSSCNTKTEVVNKVSIQGDTSKTLCCSQTRDCSTDCSTK